MGQQGSVYRQKKSRFWYISWRDASGRRIKESSGCERQDDAWDKLNIKLADVAKGIPITKDTGKLCLGDALKAHDANLAVRNRKSAGKDAAQRHAPLLKYFGEKRQLGSIGTRALRLYVAHRLAEKAAPGTINRELAALRRSYRLAQEDGDVLIVPKFPMCEENAARTGFFERPEFEAVRDQLPAHVRPLVTFAYWTGWRVKSEIVPLTAGQVDLARGVVRLEAAMTKTRKAREFYFSDIDELRTMLTEQIADLDRLKARNVICPYVFHTDDGQRIRTLRHAWEAARTAAGYPQKLLHDFRRTAARNMDRASVPRKAAMAMIGHKTQSMYDRYAISDETMEREGARKYAAWAAGKPAEKKATGKVRQFKTRAS